MRKLLIVLISSLSIFSFGLNTSLASSEGNIASPGYMINVGDIYPGIQGPSGTSQSTTNWLLGTIIQNLMIALGALSILVMTIGAGFMILNSGDESLLTKGKTIFMSGIYAMVIALASYYMVAIIRFLLYN